MYTQIRGREGVVPVDHFGRSLGGFWGKAWGKTRKTMEKIAKSSDNAKKTGKIAKQQPAM